jgi:uncharacterized damage-inducible protein DinB
MQLPSYISTRMQYQHKSLVDIIDGLSEEQIRRNVIAGKWSIFENIVHLQTYQHIFCDRMNLMLQEENPTFPRYSADADPLFLDNCHITTREIMQDFITVRKEMVLRTMNLMPEQLQRSATHPFFGKMNMVQWLNFFLMHESHHFFTIFKLTAELKRL